MKDKLVKAFRSVVAAEVNDPQARQLIRAVAFVAVVALLKSFGVSVPTP